MSGVVKKMKIFHWSEKWKFFHRSVVVKKMEIFSLVRGGQKNEIFSQVKKMKIF
jgi:hypothetical protein